jgi:anti-sigma-K factor RskA
MSVHEQFADDLTLYALGTLQGSERAALEAHLGECAACRRELQELSGDMGLLGMATMGPEPPPRARARLLLGLAKEPRVPVVRQQLLRWWLVVPVGAAIVLAVVSIVLWRRDEALRQDLAQQLAQSAQNRVELERAREVLELLSAPDAMRITLVATNAKPQPQGKAIYRQRTGSLVFLASNFAPLPPKKAYELWLLPASGAAPIPAGVFKPDARGSASVLLPTLPKDLEAKAFAITIEPQAGSSTPTMPVVLAGGR